MYVTIRVLFKCGYNLQIRELDRTKSYPVIKESEFHPSLLPIASFQFTKYGHRVLYLVLGSFVVKLNYVYEYYNSVFGLRCGDCYCSQRLELF